MAVARRGSNSRAWLRQARIGSGLVLMAFALTHFLNHALGLHSVALMEQARPIFGFWHQPWAWPILTAAILVHMAAALLTLYQRRSLRLPPWQWLQLVSGLAIPFLLALHYIANRWLPVVAGQDGGYALQLVLLQLVFRMI